MPSQEHGRIVETTEEARAAVTGTGLSRMLLWGTSAVIVLFAAVALFASSRHRAIRSIR